MSILFIRHGKKTHKNNRAPVNGKNNDYYGLDPDLTLEGKEEAGDKFRELINNHQIPDKIITSPYLRTRKTAEIAQTIIFEVTSQFVEIIIDKELSEFLNKQKHDTILGDELHPDTWHHKPKHPEYKNQYKKRMNRCYNSYKNKNNVWVITHGLNIQAIASEAGHNILYPDEVSGFKLQNNEINTI